MSEETSARLGLPYLVPGQAQKEMTHNEALAMVDIVAGGAVVAVGASVVPATPVVGDCWIVGTGAGGAWSGRAGWIAGWTAGGWRFVAPREGLAMRVADTGRIAVYRDGAWSTDAPLGDRGLAIPDPAGGTTEDIEARSAISAILLRLRDFGLIDAT